MLSRKRGQIHRRGINRSRRIAGSIAVIFSAASVLGLAPMAAGASTLSAVTAVGGQGVGTGANQLLDPSQVALDSHGDLFVVDNADRVVEYPLSATTGSYATTGTIVEGLATPVDAGGIALDAAGDLFVSDEINNRVLEFPANASNGTYPTTGITVAGTGGQGSGASALNGPTYLALDGKGDLFVADSGNNRVQEFVWNSTTSNYSATGITVAGTGGSGSGSSQLSDPGPLALDPNGDLFVGDNGNHRVQEFAINAATGAYASAGVTAYSEAGVPVTFGQLAFSKAGDLFLTWTYPPAEPVVELAPNANGTYSTVATTVPIYNTPLGIAVNASGNLFVSEGNLPYLPSSVPADLVQELSPTSTPGTYSATASFSTVQGTGASPLTGPQGVAVDQHGNLYATSSDAVLEFPLNTATGTYSATGVTVAGSGGAGSGANELSDPDALALDSHGDLFIADAGNDRVVEYAFNAATGTFSATGITVAGSGGAGSGANELSNPETLALDSHGDLFIADAGNNRVVEYALNATTGAYSATGTTLATSGQSVALDSHGDLFVGDPENNRIVDYPLSTATGLYATTGTVVAQFGGTGPGAIADGPGSILVDARGDIFAGGGFYTDSVAEFPVNTSTGKYPSTPTTLLSGPGSGPSQVLGVWGLAVDAHGDLFIADDQNNRIQELPGIASTAPAPPPAPVVTGISPASGPAAGGTAVTVSGSNLSSGSVSFGSTPATSSSCTASSCTASSPAGSGTVNVTVTTTGGTSATASADQFTYQAAPPSSNLIPNPGFESAGVPNDDWGSTLARSQAVVHSGSWSLAQTLTSSSGGWDMDTNPSWYAPISSADSYTAQIWVYATASVKVNLNLDLLTSSGDYVDSATGPNVTLTAGTWTQLTLTGIRPAAGEVYGTMEPNFLKGTKGAIIYWDDMSLTS
jgi:tripartite motif-containing protein 71